MKESVLYKKAVRLSEGGYEECCGHLVKAVFHEGDENSCFLCEMDSICNMDMLDLCAEVGAYRRRPCFLQLVTNDQ